MTTTPGLPAGDSGIRNGRTAVLLTVLGLGLGAALGWWTGNGIHTTAEGSLSGSVMVVSLWEIIGLLCTIPFNRMRRHNWVGYVDVVLAPVLVVGMTLLHAWPRGTAYTFDFRTALPITILLGGYGIGVLRIPDYHARRHQIGVLAMSTWAGGLGLSLVDYYDMSLPLALAGPGGMWIAGMVAELRAYPDRA